MPGSPTPPVGVPEVEQRDLRDGSEDGPLTEHLDCQVAIVGAGPVGLGLAVELGQRGVVTVVVEKEEELHNIPKGQNLTQRTMEHLRCWGVEAQVRQARLMPADYPSAGVNAYGNLMGEYANPWFRRSVVDPYYFTSNERLPQYLTERALRSRVEQLDSVTVLYGHEVLGIDQVADGVVVITDDSTIAARFVVGCDGSRSIVRRAVGIAQDRSDHDRRMALVVFRSTELHDLLESRFGEAAFFNVLHPDLDGYWRFLGRVDVGETWFFHAPVSPDSSEESLDASALISHAVGRGVAIDVTYLGFWDLRIAVAETYRSGNVFLAGDSAHSHPPYGGYGINTGFEDARNLGWKLAAAIQGWDGNSLLDSYDEERRPVFRSTALDFIEAFIRRDREFISRHDPEVDEDDFVEAWRERGSAPSRGISQFEPHYEGSSLVVGGLRTRPSAIGQHTFDPRPGHHLPPPENGDRDEVFDLLGNGFTLIDPRVHRATGKSFADAAAALGVPMSTVDASLHPAVSGYGESALLVRPDHYVSWVDAGSLFDAREVLTQAIGGSSPGH